VMKRKRVLLVDGWTRRAHPPARRTTPVSMV